MEIEEIRRKRFLQLLEEGGRGFAKELAEKIGCDSSYISQVKTNKKNIGSQFARDIESAVGKPRGWMDSINEPLQLGPFTLQTVAESPGQNPRGKIPLISWVAAGSWDDPVDNYPVGDAENWLDCPSDCRPETSFALTVTGPSMDDGTADGYRDGETIYVDGSQIEPLHNKDFIVKNRTGQVTFKRMIASGGTWYLKPLNERWPEPIIEIGPDAQIVGRVVHSGKSR